MTSAGTSTPKSMSASARDVGDRRLERAERAQPGDGGGARVDELGLIEDESGGGQHGVAVLRGLGPRGDLPEATGDQDAAVRRIGLLEHRPGEHRYPLIGRVGELEHVVLEPHPEVLRLVEHRCLRRRVRVHEGRLGRSARLRERSPSGVAPTHQVAPVEVVVGIHRRAGLLGGRHARVEVPVARSRQILQGAPVDVDPRHGGEAPDRVEDHREAQVGQRGEPVQAPGLRHPDRDIEEVGVVPGGHLLHRRVRHPRHRYSVSGRPGLP